MVRIGRYTAALSLTGLGVLLLLDHAGYADTWNTLRVWWPAVLVLLGLELIILQARHREEGTRVRLSIGTLLGAFVLGGVVLAAAKGSELALADAGNWTKGIHLGFYDSDRSQFSFDKGVTSVPLQDAGRKVTVTDVNGRVTLAEGPVADIEVKAVLYVDVSDKSRAEQLADASFVEITKDDGIAIEARLESYGAVNLRKPRMDMTITFPQGHVPERVEVTVGNGSIRIDGLPASKELSLDLKNGDIGGSRIGGTLRVKLLSGDMRLSDLMGDADLQIVNGQLEVDRAAGALAAKIVNGDVRIRSDKVGGAWNVASTLGDLTLAWPEGANVAVSAKAKIDEVASDWPLEISEHAASGKLGDGTWPITAETHGKISLEKFRP